MVALESAIASPCLFACALLEARAGSIPSSRKSPKKAQSPYTRTDMGKVRLRLRQMLLVSSQAKASAQSAQSIPY